LINSLNKFWEFYQKARAVFSNCHYCTMQFKEKLLKNEKAKFLLEPNFRRQVSEYPATYQGVKIESVLQVKFGYINEELAQIIEPLIQLETLACTHKTDYAARSLGIISSF